MPRNATPPLIAFALGERAVGIPNNQGTNEVRSGVETKRMEANLFARGTKSMSETSVRSVGNASEIKSKAGLGSETIKYQNPNDGTGHGHLKQSKAKWVSPPTNQLAEDRAKSRRAIEVAKMARQVKVADEKQATELKTNASDDPCISKYARSWADHFVSITTEDGDSLLFANVNQAVRYINCLDGSSDLTESWLSLLLANGYSRYGKYQIGLVAKNKLGKA